MAPTEAMAPADVTGRLEGRMDNDDDAAVLVRKAYKVYRSKSLFRKTVDNQVIQGLDMTVRRGTIYGLLGASGCGKTTMLKSIVGQDKLTSGEVRTLGRTPGAPGSGVPGSAVGYMPQELALYIGFTIGETFRYFGWLSGIPKEELALRTAALIKFLDLPPAHCVIGQLSGGQQRRVSFAVALLHQPPLLILDEPTVGVDPLLRQRIWDHLMDITADGSTTVIITTHYIEEARQANTLGLMREGVLLAEDAPDRLLERHRCSNMEDVFLRLSVLQTRTNRNSRRDDAASEQVDTPSRSVLVPTITEQSVSPTVLTALPVRRRKSASPSQLPLPLAPLPFGRKGARKATSWTTRMACLLWKHALWMRRNVA